MREVECVVHGEGISRTAFKHIARKAIARVGQILREVEDAVHSEGVAVAASKHVAREVVAYAGEVLREVEVAVHDEGFTARKHVARKVVAYGGNAVPLIAERETGFQGEVATAAKRVSPFIMRNG